MNEPTTARTWLAESLRKHEQPPERQCDWVLRVHGSVFYCDRERGPKDHLPVRGDDIPDGLRHWHRFSVPEDDIVALASQDEVVQRLKSAIVERPPMYRVDPDGGFTHLVECESCPQHRALVARLAQGLDLACTALSSVPLNDTGQAVVAELRTLLTPEVRAVVDPDGARHG